MRWKKIDHHVTCVFCNLSFGLQPEEGIDYDDDTIDVFTRAHRDCNDNLRLENNWMMHQGDRGHRMNVFAYNILVEKALFSKKKTCVSTLRMKSKSTEFMRTISHFFTRIGNSGD